MHHRAFPLKLQKQLDDGDDDGTFEGWLATYNNVDEGGDTILPGAFTRTLANQGNKVPLLWQHDSTQPVGTLSLTDSDKGLLAKGSLLLSLPTAQSAYTLLKAGVIKGLSIGYDTIKQDFVDNVRVLKELRLWEGSLVTFPMDPQAQVMGVKGFDDAVRLVGSADAKDPQVAQYLRNLSELAKARLGGRNAEDDAEVVAAIRALAEKARKLTA